MRQFGRIALLVRVVVLLAACFAAGVATAQPSGQANAATADRLAALEKSSAAQAAAIAAAQSAGDNAWMLASSALVLLMSGPGLALFYGGLVRRKNVLGTMMQTFAMMAVITVLWGLVTYSLAFGEGSAFIGGLHNVFLRGVGLEPDPKSSS
jgi:Amt family ammonium transporter